MKAVSMFLLALLPGLALSQEKVTKLVRVHYADAHTIGRLATTGAAVNSRTDDALKAIVLQGEPAAVAAVEQVIHELDVPSAAPASKEKNIEVVVSVIGASNSRDLPTGAEMPDAMAVVKQLRAIFPYKNYQLLSSMLLRSREGSRADSKGIMKSIHSSPHPSNYDLAYDDASATAEETKPIIHLHNFHFTTHVPVVAGSVGGTTQFQSFQVGIATDVDLREGQKTVVGKADIGSSDAALFVVLTARLVD